MLEKFAQRLKNARESKNISQRKLGMILGLSDKAISAYESGRTYPPLDTLLKMSKELNRPVAYFLGEDSQDDSLMRKIDNLSFELKNVSEELENTRKLIIKDLKTKGELPPVVPEG
jgi:transcriptional regulator with XRE-family HTH domain